MLGRFGAFELDTVQCRLTKNGEAIRLEKQPLDLLILLVERHHELVKREEIASVLWGDSTFVDAEHGVNTAIRKVRAALGDDPANPHYVETVVRRGYRFKGELVVVPVLALPPPVSKSRPVPKYWMPAAVSVLMIVVGCVVAWRSTHAATGLPSLRWRSLTKSVHTFWRMASDGKRVYWTEFDESGCRPYSVALAGGESMPLAMPFRNAAVLDFSGHRLLLNARENCKGVILQGPLWTIDVETGETRRVGDLSAQDAAYSPDGSQLAYANGNQIWLASADGAGARKLAELPNLVWTLHWSPDAASLRFSVHSAGAGRLRLWEVLLNGQVKPMLASWDDSSERLGGVWIDGGDFVFSALRHGSMDLWRMHPRLFGMAQPAIEQLTAGPLDWEAATTVPGSHEVAVIGTRRAGELSHFDAKAGKFVPFLGGISAEMVDFSRDGKWVVYVSYPDNALWRCRADGSEPLQLTHAPWQVGAPRISPDSTRIAFTGLFPGAGMRNYVIPLDGGTPAAATGDVSTIEVAPTWSADGTRLLYRRDNPGGDTMLQHNVLQIVELGSRKVETLSDSNKRFNQRWSPDGKWIVATNNDETELDLYDVAAKSWSMLAKISADYPSWSADSQYVHFCSFQDKGAAFYRVRIRGGKPGSRKPGSRKPELVAAGTGIDRVVDDIFGQWAGLTPDGSPLILRDGTQQQIYALSFERR